MNNTYKKLLYTSISTGIIFFCFGLFLFLKPETTINSISYLLGGILIIVGFVTFLKYILNNDKVVKKFDVDLVYGIVGIVAGLVLILNPTAIATIIPFILGMWIVINSAIKLQYALTLKQFESSHWKIPFTIAIISLIWGIILIFNPFQGAVLITKVIGIFVMVYALLEITEGILFHKNGKLINQTTVKIEKE